MDCNKKTDEQLVIFAVNIESRGNQLTPLQSISEPINSIYWITNKFKSAESERGKVFQKWVTNRSYQTRDKH